MTAAAPADASGGDAAARLGGLRDPAVRDLAWLLFSADLLRAQLPQGPLAEPWADSAGAEAAAQWLARLDADPTPLREALKPRAPTRLGRYAEILLGWYLEHGPSLRLVAANVPLRRAGRTLGECDFLVETADGRRLHWELAVKCYLHTGESRATLADFVGPNLRDRFDRKLAHLLDHQLRLSEREEFVSLGYPGPWLAQMFVKGWLFYRAGAAASDSSSLAPGHARGWWVTRSEWPAFAAQHGADGWSVLPRLAWLAPRRIAADALSGDAADGIATDAHAGKAAGGTAMGTFPAQPASAMPKQNVARVEVSSRAAEMADPIHAPAPGDASVAGSAAPDAPENRVRRSRTLADQMSITAPVDPETLLASLQDHSEPTMVAAFAADSANGYVERSRGFIVPDDWPARARAFAHE